MDATTLHIVRPKAALHGTGCSLIFKTHSEGVLLTKWGSEPAPDACVFYVPRDVSKVPKFKLNSKTETELTRGFGGSNRTRFYEGICSFVRACVFFLILCATRTRRARKLTFVDENRNDGQRQGARYRLLGVAHGLG